MYVAKFITIFDDYWIMIAQIRNKIMKGVEVPRLKRLKRESSNNFINRLHQAQ